MALKKNIMAGYVSQMYITLIGVVMAPVFIKYMGAEAFGLVAFFTMLQAWFNLLDMGLTPTMTRETARFRGGSTDALAYRRLVRALECIFMLVALVGGMVLFSATDYLASDWLQATKLPIAEVETSLKLISIVISLRFMCGLYRGAISGAEQFVWLGFYNSVIATLRFVFVLPFFIFFGVTPTVFFGYQLGVAVIELIVLVYYTYRLLPVVLKDEKLPVNMAHLRQALKFSLSVAFASSVGILVGNTDKFLLSKILTLADYGYFTLATLVASGVLVVSGPIAAAI